MDRNLNSKNRTRSISCKVKEEEHRWLQLLADREGRPLGEWCREVILGTINQRYHECDTLLKLILEEQAAMRSHSDHEHLRPGESIKSHGGEGEPHHLRCGPGEVRARGSDDPSA